MYRLIYVGAGCAVLAAAALFFPLFIALAVIYLIVMIAVAL